MSISQWPVKRIPQRTCVACRSVRAKRELVRLVRTADEKVEIDVSGRKAGRGAYLCQSQGCWETGVKGGRLEHSLKTTLTQHEKEQLMKLRESLPKEQKQ